MKSIITISLLFLSLFVEADSWVRKTDFGGVAREGTFSFSIGNKGYVGAGQDSFGIMQQDFWQYDPSLNSWTQKANYAGGAFIYGIGFSILNKGYAGLGQTSFSGDTNQFYEYDPTTNMWTQKSNYPSMNVFWPVSFSIGNFGYVCTGSGATFSDSLRQYDPVLDVWTLKNHLPGLGRSDAIGFSIGTKGYVGTGNSSCCGYLKDFWEYNSLTDSWTQKANYPFNRMDAGGFSICNKGYIAMGEADTPGYFLKDLWEYDTTANQWTRKANFIGANRDEYAFFVIGDKAYIGLGGSFGAASKDFYEYTPDSCGSFGEDINELSTSGFQFQVWPNPANQSAVISWSDGIRTPYCQWQSEQSAVRGNVEITIFDAIGRKVFSQQLQISNFKLQTVIDVSGLSQGLYFIVADDGRERAVSKFVKE